MLYNTSATYVPHIASAAETNWGSLSEPHISELAAGGVVFCRFCFVKVGRVDRLTVYLYLRLPIFPPLLNDSDLNIHHGQLQMTQLYDGHGRICHRKLHMTS